MYPIPCLVLCLVAASHQFTISKFEVPDAVEVGGDASLRCEHDARPGVVVKWFWVRPGDDTPHQLYQRVDDDVRLLFPQVDPPFNITSNGRDNIMLWNLQPIHSGEYTCQVVVNMTEERRNAKDLVVYSLGSGPLLNVTKFEGEQEVQVTCEAVGVTPEPDLTITFDSKTFNTSLLHGPADGLYNVFANTTVKEEELEGKEVYCKLSFKLYAIDVPTSMTGISLTYHSDAWLATTTEIVETSEATELGSTIETPEQLLPGSGGRPDSSWLLLAALSIPAYILVL